ncbi:hypothetical protein Peur_038905 [Populus x canadensis]
MSRSKAMKKIKRDKIRRVGSMLVRKNPIIQFIGHCMTCSTMNLISIWANSFLPKSQNPDQEQSSSALIWTPTSKYSSIGLHNRPPVHLSTTPSPSWLPVQRTINYKKLKNPQ